MVRRLRESEPSGRALTGRGSRARRTHPRREPAVDRRHAQSRLQGSVRDGGDRRLPLRLRRDRARRRRLDVRTRHRGVRRRPRSPEVLRRIQSMGAALDRRASSRSVRAGAVERNRRVAARLARRRARSRRLGRAPVTDEITSWESGAAVPLRFSPVVGQEQAKLALLLAAIEPRLGGVLLRGQKGSAKTTLARGFARLLPGAAPFVELPLGASEDRVLGSLDLAELLTNGTPRLRPGLLAAAHGGVLYVDEINLLADHLVDVLLDVALSGVNRVEREGISHTHPARFVLIGSMNPEEGELRPQLLDRFGLAVDIAAPVNVEDRVESVRRRLAFDETGEIRPGGEMEARPMPENSAALADDVLAAASRLALQVGAEGLRADL